MAWGFGVGFENPERQSKRVAGVDMGDEGLMKRH